jgi:putative DeoR family transcriptional regulator, stage III sporulation protein D
MRSILRRYLILKDYIEERVLDVARYIIESKATIRKTARMFGVSKSTVHKDVTERLPKINPQIAKEAKEILDLNKSERHIRGGKATKLKYKVVNI